MACKSCQRRAAQRKAAMAKTVGSNSQPSNKSTVAGNTPSAAAQSFKTTGVKR